MWWPKQNMPSLDHGPRGSCRRLARVSQGRLSLGDRFVIADISSLFCPCTIESGFQLTNMYLACGICIQDPELELKRIIGEGTFGRIYQAQHLPSGNEVKPRGVLWEQY